MRASLLEFVAPSVCPACDARREEGETLLCPGCRAELLPLDSLRGVHTALVYEGRGAELIRRFKFEQRSDALAVLLEPLARRVARLRYDGIVPTNVSPDDLGRIVDEIVSIRGDLAGFDVAIPVTPRLRLADYADRGVTWAMHSFWYTHRPSQVLGVVSKPPEQ